MEQDRIEKWNSMTRRDKIETIQQEIASGTENLPESPIPKPVPIIVPAKIQDSVPREPDEGPPPKQADQETRDEKPIKEKKQLKINQFTVRKENSEPEIKIPEIPKIIKSKETQKPKNVKNLAPKETRKTNVKKKKEIEEEKNQNHKKKMKGYWLKLNDRKLAEKALYNRNSNSTSTEVAPAAGRLG